MTVVGFTLWRGISCLTLELWWGGEAWLLEFHKAKKSRLGGEARGAEHHDAMIRRSTRLRMTVILTNHQTSRRLTKASGLGCTFSSNRDTAASTQLAFLSPLADPAVISRII